MSIQIKKHYINVQGRRVHFRSGGVGPVMLLLHQSPQSSRTMLPLATVIGVHTGAGQGSAHHLRQILSIPYRIVCPVECRDQCPVPARLEDEA